MNHQKIYQNIIQKAKIENRIKLKKDNPFYVYYEKHHIIPKCLGGNDDEKNLILLTAKEHYLCHKLLTFIYSKNRKIINAFHYMTINKRYMCISSRNYAYEKQLYALTPVSEETKQKMRKPKSEETKKKFKEAWIKRRVEKPTTKETKNKIRKALTGKHHSQETKDLIGLNWLGRSHSEKSKNKISKANKGLKRTNEVKELFSKQKKYSGNSRAKKILIENTLTGQRWFCFGTYKKFSIENKNEKILQEAKRSGNTVNNWKVKELENENISDYQIYN